MALISVGDLPRSALSSVSSSVPQPSMALNRLFAVSRTIFGSTGFSGAGACGPTAVVGGCVGSCVGAVVGVWPVVGVVVGPVVGVGVAAGAAAGELPQPKMLVIGEKKPPPPSLAAGLGSLLGLFASWSLSPPNRPKNDMQNASVEQNLCVAL